LLLHARTVEVLRPLGVAEALLARADTAPTADLQLGSRVIRVTLAGFALPDTAFPHLTLIRQAEVERVLACALADRGIEVERSTELASVRDGPIASGRSCAHQEGPNRRSSISRSGATARAVPFGLRPASGGPGGRIPSRLQQVLGDHHDTVVARTLLLDLAEEARAADEDPFTYGLMYQYQADCAASMEQALPPFTGETLA
jgi:hypothetical protein